MAEKDDARRNIEQARDSMSEIAEELMRRSSPVYLKTRAKEAAVRKTTETKERIQTTMKESPMAWRLIGGAVGVGLASMLSRRYQQRERSLRGYGQADELGAGRGWRQPARVDYRDSAVAADAYGYGAGSVATEYGYGPSTPTAGVYAEPLGGEAGLGEAGLAEDRGPGVKERAASKAAELKARAAGVASGARETVSDKAGQLKERLTHARQTARERASEVRHAASDRVQDARLGARGRLDGVRERLPSREEVKSLAQDGWHRGVENDPLVILLGAVALGAVASLLLPITDRERRLTGPARDRVRGKLDEVKQEAASRLDQVRDQALDQLSSLKDQALESAQQLKGQAIKDLKGRGQAQPTPRAREGSSVTAHADEVAVSYASTLPLERDEQFRHEGLIEHTPGEKPLDPDIRRSYDPKLPH